MYTKEEARQKIKGLIDRYERLKASGEIEAFYGKGKEANTKKDFIEPLFKYLNWDVRDAREVSTEEAVIGGEVDYGFFIDGVPKFFLEAKSMGENLDHWKQKALAYGINRRVTWIILTNFKDLIVFNCEWEEKDVSKCQLWQTTTTIRDMFYNFDNLWLLSKDAFLEGSLDKYAEDIGRKKIRKSIDKILLDRMLGWRRLISDDIVKNYRDMYSEEVIDEVVQRFLVRLLFIRNCEERFEARMLQPYLKAYEIRKKPIFNNLLKVFDYYNKEYDSDIFKPTELDRITISDTVLSKVLHELHYTPDGFEYRFNIIPADIMGYLYEQYLGHILRKTPKHAKLREGTAHKKEQGIYYTPKYIVDYIVQNTLGELLKQKGMTADKIRILDPACGSGSFLISAFDVLNEYHSQKEESRQAKLDPSNIEVVFTKKKEILQNNIFGVDLDSKAVEIAQLNLLLKAAEKKHRLPTLQNNIKCGNSLIDDEKFTPRPFSWNDQFSQIMKDGGFDVMIGNPPYVRQEELSGIKPYLEANFEVYQGTADLFVYFFERELKLLKDGGYFGMIVSNKWLKAGYALNLRRFLSKYWIEQFIDFGDLNVFQDATTYPCIIIIRKINKPNPKIKVCQVKTLNFDSLQAYVKENQFEVNQKDLDENGWNFSEVESSGLLQKIKAESLPLKEYVKGDVYRGILTGLSKAFIVDEKTKEELIRQDPKSAEIIKPFLTGKEVRRYRIDFKKTHVILTKIGVDIKRYPAVLKWLEKFKPELEKRWDKGNYWYELRSCDYYDLFEKPKLIYGVITTQPRFTIDEKGYFANNANFFIPIADKKLLGILNSKFGWFLISNTCTQIRGGYQLIWKYFGNVPIAKTKSPELEKLVGKMLSPNQRLNEIGDKKTDERAKLEEEIKKTDAEIDSLVYKLYGLTNEERKIIEESLPKVKGS